MNPCKIKKEIKKEREKTILVPVCELIVEIPKNVK
jgi:hypothetical protein